MKDDRVTTQYVQARDFLLEELKSVLVGPEAADEVLGESPLSHYLTGVLYPQGSTIDPDEDNESAEADQREDPTASGLELSSSILPSAMGLTFVVAGAPEFVIQVGAGRYVALQEPGEEWTSGWKRVPIVFEEVCQVQSGDLTELHPAEGLRLFIRWQSVGGDLTGIFTLMLINDLEASGSAATDPELCFFQPQIRVKSVDSAAIFPARTGVTFEQANRGPAGKSDLIYRYAREFAVGHGCAPEWSEPTGDAVSEIWTTMTPSHEVPAMEPAGATGSTELSMLKLSELDADAVKSHLSDLPGGYSEWIENQVAEAVSLPAEFQAAAEQNIDACREALGRMRAGLHLLESDGTVFEAFRLANRAMYLQRVWSVNGRHSPALTFAETLDTRADEHFWYPFQLAFILMVIPSIVEPIPERDLVDLLWFPTGGGKTEAYLGLVAFTIFLRRLRGEQSRSAGVTAIMRYTLRLLTLQQFQRASAMICAAELLRRQRSDLGEEAISIGLWVGGDAVPNTLKQAEASLQELRTTGTCEGGNPVQLRSCPACGTDLTDEEYRIDGSLSILCPNDQCEFHGGIPARLVDEDIYKLLPSLLIGTVDKFARLPWKEEAGRLFAKGGTAFPPPELIIQDELHLIAGPLGTLVGLYETAIDGLSTVNGRKPKIIASTATIQRAADQVHGLFARDVRQFPPSGLDARDSYFSREIPPDEEPGRLYVGLMAPGRSMKTALVHAAATLLQRPNELEVPDEVRDAYWTLVGYFNSIRELGGSIRLVQDDIPARMEVITGAQQETRTLRYPTELYSGVDSEDIPAILEDLFRAYPDQNPVDVLLATSMISVGVDIDRLSLMIVQGQPKSSAEYIQATSRVGRKYPGLVLTIYNWARPRDRSHFERFCGYHQALYSSVEAASVTPFSSRARDRGLHGVLVSLVRHEIKKLQPEDAARDFDANDERIGRIVDRILERVEAVDPAEVQDTREQLEAIMARWARLTTSDYLRYGRLRFQPKKPHLLYPAEERESGGLAFPTLNSLRSVEPSSSIYLVEYSPEDGE